MLIAASPTRGLDVGAIETVHAYLREAAAEGVAVLLISEDLDEILALADRVVVVYEGELTGEFDPRTATIEEIGLAMAGRREVVIAVERRLTQPRWLTYAVPFVSVAVAFVVMAVVLLATGHDPVHTYRRLFDAAFHGSAAWTDTVTLATPLIFTGLAAAVAFRMQLFNIGAEGQLYIGAICATGVAIWLGPHHGLWMTILAMCVCGAAGAALWALIAGVLKAFARTNEIITTLMLNYVAGLLLTYMIFDSASPWRDLSTIQTRSFPQSVALKPSQFWPTVTVFGVSVSFGFLLALGVAVALYVLFRVTRFGFEMNVIGDSPAGRPLLGHADAAEDPRGDGDLRRGRGARRRQPDRRLLARPRRQSAGTPGRELRLHGHRRRRARPIQPVRRLPGRRPPRRAPERRAVPAGGGLPVGPRRRDAGDHPVLRARRRDPRPLPGAHRTAAPPHRLPAEAPSP